MTDLPKRGSPWWLLTLQWVVMAGLTVFAFVNSVTDHGIQMAFNCFCLGFMFFALLAGAWIRRHMERLDALMVDLRSAEAMAIGAHETMTKAINDGFIEVIPMVPSDLQPPTKH